MLEMTYDKFVEKVEEILDCKPKKKRGSKDPLVHLQELCSSSWTTGGMTGGTCWSSEHYPIEAEPECELEELDKILEFLCPGITYLQYKKIERLITITFKNDGSDYYGNWTEYKYKRISLTVLYRALQEIS